MSYGRTFTEWRAQAPDWDAYTRHPFVQGMADGSLPRDAFLNYLVQDYLFLIHFARAWALAVVKAGDLDEMRACSAVVHTLIDHEMALHVETCAAAGIDTDAMLATPEALTNIAYTRYVLDAGLSGDFLDLLAALIAEQLEPGRTPQRPAQDGRVQQPAQPLAGRQQQFAGDHCPSACKAWRNAPASVKWRWPRSSPLSRSSQSSSAFSPG